MTPPGATDDATNPAGPRRRIGARRGNCNEIPRDPLSSSASAIYHDRMSGFTPDELAECERLIEWGVREDLGDRGDVKYAVRCGGGENHRLGLFDAVLIKDNHLAALADHPDPIGEAVRRAREAVGRSIIIEVEVDTLDQLDAALRARPEIILLDNFSAE